MTTVRKTITVVALLSGIVSSAFGQFTSEDFNNYNLNRTRWTYVDPLKEGTIGFTGVGSGDAHLTLTVPEGSEHQPWTSGNTAPRILQACTNVDFQVEVKFQSPVSQQYQIQGLLIEADSTRFIRIDFSSNGLATQLLAVTFDGNLAFPQIQIGPDSIAPAGTGPLFLRVTRLGNRWTVTYSFNSYSYISPSTPYFDLTMTARRIGPFVGNAAGGSGIPPAHTAVIDYVWNMASSLDTEDKGSVVDARGPYAYNIVPTPGVVSAVLNWKTDENARTVIQFGTTTAYGRSVSDATLRSAHSMTLTGLTASTPYNYRIISEDVFGNKDTTSNLTFLTVAITPPVITLWNGSVQTFGKVGTAQRSVSIMGNVADTARIDSFYYRLNGGPRIPLSFGPDGRRLQRPGDFVVDPSYAALNPGANTIVITARNMYGGVATSTLTVNDNSGKVWPLPYSVAFTAPASLLDSGHVVDGKWALATGGVRTTETGYNRGIAIGDTSWTDCQLTTQFTVHRIDSTYEVFNQYGGPGFGLLMRWKGHTDQPEFFPPITQPKAGYLPLGAVGWFHWREGFDNGLTNRWELFGNNLALKDTSAATSIEYGRTYNLKMLVRNIPGLGGYYALRVWPAGQSEPSTWSLVAQEGPGDPLQGSILVLANFVDVTFGKVTVVPGSSLGPTITSVEASAGSRSAVVTWVTDTWTRSTLVYGKTTAYGDTIRETDYQVFHSNLIGGLSPSTTYHYKVSVVDSLGRSAVTGDGTFTTTALPPASNLVWDDFNTGVLNTSVWTSTIPAPPGGALIGATGVEAFISLSEGVAHDLWTGGNTVPRIMQSCNNTDFDVVVKYNSSVGGSVTAFQAMGILVEQDPDNLIRFDLNSGTTDSISLFAATFEGGLENPVIRVTRNVAPHGVAPIHLRVIREGNIWTVAWSFDGTTWKTGGVFPHALTVTKVGMFAGNPGSSPPSFSALMDYFRTNGGVVSVPGEETLPTEFALDQNYPNPFNPSTTIHFAIPHNGRVTLEVFSLLGQKVTVLLDEPLAPGYYSRQFDGQGLSSGMYICRLTGGGRAFQRKMMLVK